MQKTLPFTAGGGGYNLEYAGGVLSGLDDESYNGTGVGDRVTVATNSCPIVCWVVPTGSLNY